MTAHEDLFEHIDIWGFWRLMKRWETPGSLMMHVETSQVSSCMQCDPNESKSKLKETIDPDNIVRAKSSKSVRYPFLR